MRTTAKKTTHKVAAKKVVAKKRPAKKGPAKKVVTKKVAAKKVVAKKGPAKKRTAKKVAAKKVAAKKRPAKKVAAKKTTTRPKSASSRHSASNVYTHLLDVPYSDRRTAAWSQARWDNDLRTWVYQTEKGFPLPPSLTAYAAPAYSWQAWRQTDLNGEARPACPGDGVVLHPHQVEAATMVEVAYRSGRPGVLIADEVGLGKTFSALAGVNRIDTSLNVLVLCPLSVVAHWRASITALGTHHRLCVVNYDKAKTLLEVPASAQTAQRTRTRNRRIATTGSSLVQWDIIIADEAHLLKNPTSQRSAAVRQLQGGKRATSFVVWCSATAGQNPVELAYLSRLISAKTGHRVGADLDDFESWCRSMDIRVKKSYGGLAWSPNDADLVRMNELLFSDGITAIRRRPTDIAGWPELERIAWPVELTPADYISYQSGWETVKDAVVADSIRRSNGTHTVQASANPLVALLRFRQSASLLRTKQTVDFVSDLLANGKQVAVSVEFRDTVDDIIEKLRMRRIAATSIHGGLSPEEREQNRLAFQQGHVPVIVFTVREGISLHAGEESSRATHMPRATIIHDPRWDAISTAQIEGRTWRDGQRSTCYHAFGEHTVEARVVGTMLRKLEAMKTMLHDSDVDDVLSLLERIIDDE